MTITTTQSTSVTEYGNVKFDVRLNTKPTAEVRLRFESKNATRATLSPNELVFVPAHWNVPQQVTVNAAANLVDDGDIDVAIAAAPLESTDIAYLGLDPDDLKVRVLDDDTAGITVGALQATEIDPSRR